MITNKILSAVKKSGFFVLFAIVAFYCTLKMVNLHTDGSTITPGNHRICTHNQAYALYLDDMGTVAWGVGTEITPQWFTLSYIGDGNYLIADENGRLMTMEGSGAVMKEGTDAIADSQIWKVERIGASQYFKITNLESGYSVYKNKDGIFELREYNDDDNMYYLTFA